MKIKFSFKQLLMDACRPMPSENSRVKLIPESQFSATINGQNIMNIFNKICKGASVAMSLALCLMSTSLFAQSEAEEFEIIKNRYIETALNFAPEPQVLEQYLSTLNFETGAWSDVDYESTIGSGWKTLRHTARTQALATYYRKHKETLATDEKTELLSAIHAVWGYWFREKPRCKTNWFPNVIGCPMTLNMSFLLMEDEMTEQEMEYAKKIVFTKTRIFKTGANLCACANINLMRAFITDDYELAREAIAAIAGTVYIAKRGEEGIQPDYSYHLHGPQQQFGNYGLAVFSQTYSKLCNILANTSYAFSAEKIDILVNFLSEGYDWILWNGYMDINSSGRQFGPDNLKSKGEGILVVAERLLPACNDEQRERVENLIDSNTKSKRVSALGQKVFFCSDGMYHHTQEWGASLKMSSILPEGDPLIGDVENEFRNASLIPGWARSILDYSTRVVGAEQSGNDNRKGRYIADGAFYTIVDGDEYEGVAVLWDWRKIPGITCYEGDDPTCAELPQVGVLPPNESSFVGTCTDKKSGITSMIFKREGLFAHKTWVVTDDFVLALGSDIRDESGKATLTTSIDQKLAKSELLHLDGKKWSPIDDVALFNGARDLRLHHDKTGYIILDGGEVETSIEHRAGDWVDITRSSLPTPVEGDVFSLFIRHRREGDSYKYIVLPAYTPKETAKFDVKAIDIIQNDTDAAIVKYNDTYYISAFVSGIFNADNIEFKVTKPGIFMIEPTPKGDSKYTIFARDPTVQELYSNAEEMVEML